MRFSNIALMGKARSGKDSVAAELVAQHGYTRLAFADPLKEMALTINPHIHMSYQVWTRLEPLVSAIGWERAKDDHPEVRRLLQAMGQTVRSYDPAFWVRALIRKTVTVDGPIVVTDVRYPNEHNALRRAGFDIVRITRPGAGTLAHESESALDEYPADATIPNDGTLAELGVRANLLAEYLAN